MFNTEFMRTGTFLVIELGKVCILYFSLFWIFFTMKNYNMKKREIVFCVFMWNSVSCFSKNTMKSLHCLWYKHFIETICCIFIEFSLKKANFPQQIVPEAINPVFKKKKHRKNPYVVESKTYGFFDFCPTPYVLDSKTYGRWGYR